MSEVARITAQGLIGNEETLWKTGTHPIFRERSYFFWKNLVKKVTAKKTEDILLPMPGTAKLLYGKRNIIEPFLSGT